MTGQGGHQPCTVAGDRALLGRGQGGIRNHLYGSGFHQCSQIGRAVAAVLPDVPAVRHGHVGTGDQRRSVCGEPGIEPVLLALEPGRRDVGIVFRLGSRGEQRPEIQVVAVDVQLGHRRDHGVDFVLLAGQGRDQLTVVQPG